MHARCIARQQKKHAGTIFLMLEKWWRWQEIDTRAE
jgi:hypothetical protein